jgi:hypothetical protein
LYKDGLVGKLIWLKQRMTVLENLFSEAAQNCPGSLAGHAFDAIV